MTGKLISLDELLRFPIRADHCDKEHANEDFINGIETVFEYVETLPTVDPVKHGKWFYLDDDMDFYDTYTCSECDFEITVDSESRCDMGMVIEDVLYCPHCGARMDGCN